MDAGVLKSDLHSCLQMAREALLWKLEDLSEYEVRRPMVRTGTNLLGILKHVATVVRGPTPMPPSKHSIWTRSVRCRGGRRTDA